MAARDLPVRPSVTQYKKQAKKLLKRWKASDPQRTSRLADAQHAIAREYGFNTVEPGWLSDENAQANPRMVAALSGKTRDS